MSRRHHMLKIAPFAPQDMDELAPCALALRELAVSDRYALAAHRAAQGNAFSARDSHGRLLCCAGITQVHASYGTLWALYAERIGAGSAAGLIRATAHFIECMRGEFTRIDAMVAVDEPKAAKWAMACGLTLEARLADAHQAGGDLLIFRKVWA